MSDILSRIVSPSELVENQGAKILMYGASGAGKTTTCATAPGKTLIISMEAGLLSIKDANNVTAIEVKEASEIESHMEFSEFSKNEPLGVTLYNDAPIVHKLSHQQLYITYWKVKTKALLEGGMFENQIHNYPVPRVLDKFIKNFYL